MLALFMKAAARSVLTLAVLCAPQIAHAQELSDKERSQKINLKAYSDEEWHEFVRALQDNLAACDEGNLQACVAAGDAYVSGDGTWPATPLAQTLYKEACDADYAAGCLALGKLNETGYEVNEYIEPIESFQRGCDLGNLDSCAKYAENIELYDDSPDAGARARAVLEQACDAGGMLACSILGEMLWDEDRARAMAILDKACMDDILAACQTLANRSSFEAQPDLATIAYYQHFACYLGDFSGCVDAGESAYLGKGITKDLDLAFAYYDKACAISSGFCDDVQSLRDLPQARIDCAADNAAACARLGEALSHILMPEYDPEQAKDLLEASCLRGFGAACYSATALMQDRQDWSDSLSSGEFMELGCKAGDNASCLSVALDLTQGRKPEDLERAVELFARLCDAGYETTKPFDPCEQESQYYGYVPAARAPVADTRYYPPLGPEVDLGRLQLGCRTHSVLFRGQSYAFENCPRVEKGMNSYPIQPGQAPWQALLWRPKQLDGQELADAYRVKCGGSLIAKGWILTAAHCLVDAGGTKVATAGHRIRLGVHDPNGDEGVSFPILRTIPHPKYKKSNKYVFDIALIQYDHKAGEKGAATNSIKPITLDPLPVGNRKIEQGMPVYAYGWGLTELEGKTTDYLQGMKMELATEQACTAQTRFRNSLANAALCAGGSGGEQACYGDSGGPLVYYGDGGGRPVLIGVVSAGKACGTRGDLSQYTRVAKARAWIDSYVGGSR